MMERLDVTTLNGWNTYGDGKLVVVPDGLLKTGACDPNGGYKLLSKARSDYRLILSLKRTSSSPCMGNRVAIEDAGFNGYGVQWFADNGSFAVEMRSKGSSVKVLDGAKNVPCVLNTWYTLEFKKRGASLEAKLYEGKNSFSKLLAEVKAEDDTYAKASFDRFTIRGGYDYIVNEIEVSDLGFSWLWVIGLAAAGGLVTYLLVRRR